MSLYAQCPECLQTMQVEWTHNGVMPVIHGVCCGWGHTFTKNDCADSAERMAELIDLRDLDAVVHLLGIEDSFGTAAERVREILAEIEKTKAALIAASNGNDLPHETLLPFEVKAAGPVMPEVPSVVMCDIVEDCMTHIFGEVYPSAVSRVWETIRGALLMEQDRG